MDKSLHDLVENYAEITNCVEKHDTPAAQNWPRREAPWPLLRAACVAFFRPILVYFSTKSCNYLSIYRNTLNF